MLTKKSVFFFKSRKAKGIVVLLVYSIYLIVIIAVLQSTYKFYCYCCSSATIFQDD